MKMTLMTLTAALAFSFSAQASVLKLSPGQKSNNGVNVSKSGVATIDGASFDLKTVGSGLRSKKVLIANVKVYVAQLLVSNEGAFVRKETEALKSLQDSPTVAIQLSFLRSVDAEKVQVSFREALNANHVKTTPAIKTFLDAISKGGDADSNKSLTIAAHKNSDGSETLVYEDTRGDVTTIKGDRGLTEDIFAIWLGTPSDDGVAALKKSLLSSQD